MDKPFDLVIKNARVVRPNKTSVDCLDIAVRDGKIDRIAPDIRAEQAQGDFRRPELSGVSRLRRCPYACRHLSAPRARRRLGEQGGGDGRRDVEPQLHPDRTILSQPRRSVPGIHARSLQAVRRAVLGRLRLPRRSDRGAAHRRNGASRRRSWRDVVQDFHVLWRLRIAWALERPERFSDDRPGGTLRHRAFRIHHAIRPAIDDAASRSLRITSASACTASSRKSSTPTPRSSSARASSPGCTPTAPPALRTPRGWRSGSRPISPTRRIASTSTCCT